MKLEVGMYVRDTRKGKIYKLTDFDLDFRPQKTTYDFEKASYNIIDLIEKKDIIVDKTGCFFEVMRIESEMLLSNPPQEKKYIVSGNYYNIYKFYEKDIKEILTHEQFENNCFRIGD